MDTARSRGGNTTGLLKAAGPGQERKQHLSPGGSGSKPRATVRLSTRLALQSPRSQGTSLWSRLLDHCTSYRLPAKHYIAVQLSSWVHPPESQAASTSSSSAWQRAMDWMAASLQARRSRQSGARAKEVGRSLLQLPRAAYSTGHSSNMTHGMELTRCHRAHAATRQGLA